MLEATSKHSLRELAISAECDASGVVPLAELWCELCEGTARIHEAFFDNARCYFVLETRIAEEKRTPLSSRRRHLLESLLCGEYPKALAARLRVSASTISTVGKLALQQLGLQSNLAHFHPLLAMSAQAQRDKSNNLVGRFSDFTHMGRRFRVIGVARPDRGLAVVLPPAQYAVVRGLVEGKNYLEIAKGRGTSTRTVANQVAAAFRRLGVSGRNSLLSRITADQPAWV
jgi:DNA-binding NarL/FixJ family response regulator